MPNLGIPELIILAEMIGLIFLVPAAVIVLVARALRRDGLASTRHHDPAIDALRTRFAKGEIDEVEFERLRSTLQRH